MKGRVKELYLWELRIEPFKLSCESRFQGAFTACCCVFKVITLGCPNQSNYFKNATAACSKSTLKTTVVTRLKSVVKIDPGCCPDIPDNISWDFNYVFFTRIHFKEKFEVEKRIYITREYKKTSLPSSFWFSDRNFFIILQFMLSKQRILSISSLIVNAK